MSYILEALKKAESERQLGAVPNVHAQTSNHADSEGRRSGPWIIGLLLLLAVLLAALLWRSFATPGPASSAAPSAAASPTIEAPPANTLMTMPAPAVSAPPSAPSAAPAPTAIATTAASPVPALADSAKPGPTPGGNPVAAQAAIAASVSKVASATMAPANLVLASSAPKASPPAPGVAATPVPPAIPATTPASIRPGVTEAARPADPVNNDLADEQLPFMAQLPEAIVREVPQVQIKGFIYSKTPAERSLLVGGNLYHEGDDVAPGVRLEKLLPRAAVMNYRGFRYRIAY